MMNDFSRLLEVYAQLHSSLLDVSLRLTKAPCAPIDMESPEQRTRALFGARGRR